MMPNEIVTTVCFRLVLWAYLFIEHTRAENNQTVQATDECMVNMRNHITYYCTYPGKNTPCFKASIEYNDKVYDIINVDGLALHCCTNLASCTRAEIQQRYCCSEPGCVDRCYKIERRRKFMRRRQQINQIDSLPQ